MDSFYVFPSPIGRLKATISDGYISSFCFTDDEPLFEDNSTISTLIKTWLQEYFTLRQEPKAVLPLKISGTPFQLEVYQEIEKIPFGAFITYKDIQEKIEAQTGRRVSCQAIGQALSKNPLILFYPCHRVLKKGGLLSGYAYGKERKRYLLDLEKIPYKED